MADSVLRISVTRQYWWSDREAWPARVALSGVLRFDPSHKLLARNIEVEHALYQAETA